MILSRKQPYQPSQFLTQSDFKKADPQYFSLLYRNFKEASMSHMKSKGKITKQDVLEHTRGMSMYEFFKLNPSLAALSHSKDWFFDIARANKWEVK